MVRGHKRALSDTSVGSSEDERQYQNTPTLESVSEKAEPEKKISSEDQARDKTSDMVVDPSEPSHAKDEKMNEASPSDTSTKESRSGEEAIPKHEESHTPVTTEVEISGLPNPPVSNDTVLQEIVTVSEETGEEEKKEVKVEEPPEKKKEECKETQQEAKTQTTTNGEEPTLPSDIAEPENKYNGVTEEAITEPIEVTEKTEDKIETDEEMIKKALAEDERTVPSPHVSTEELKEEQTEISPDVSTEEVKQDLPPVATEDQEKAGDKGESSEPKDDLATKGVDVVKDNSMNEFPVVVINGEKEEEVSATEEPQKAHEYRPEIQETPTMPESDQNAEVVKPDVEKEKDSDSGSSSAADTNSIDINLSISSFLSKSKEGSVSIQVHITLHRFAWNQGPERKYLH